MINNRHNAGGADSFDALLAALGGGGGWLRTLSDKDLLDQYSESRSRYALACFAGALRGESRLSAPTDLKHLRNELRRRGLSVRGGAVATA